jgi:hypothetical protein
MPPATAISASPALISAAASMIDFSPEPQTRLIVVALVPSGSPARSRAWRAGAWPTPAWSTWPIRTSSIGVSLRQACPLDRRPDRDAAKLHRRDARQRPAELADRRARRADDVDGPIATVQTLICHADQRTPGPDSPDRDDRPWAMLAG